MSTVALPYIHFFAGMGFRPAVQVMDRNQYGDRLIWIVGDDSPLDGKVPPSLTAEAGHGYGFVANPETVTIQPQATAASLSGPVQGPTHIGIPSGVFPLFPPTVGCCRTETPGAPVVIVPQPPVGPQPAPVSVMGDAGSLLLAAIAILYGRRLWRAAGRFGDWFTAERGNGPHQNGWI